MSTGLKDLTIECRRHASTLETDAGGSRKERKERNDQRKERPKGGARLDKRQDEKFVLEPSLTGLEEGFNPLPHMCRVVFSIQDLRCVRS